MKLYSIVLLLLIIGLFSCSNIDTNKKNNDTAQLSITQKLPIDDYIKKFTLIDLPFYFEGWNRNNIDRDKLLLIDKTSIDTLFFKGENDDLIYRYGLLSDTKNFYSLLYFGQAEELYPILVTYSKSGQLISKETLVINGCGPDCGLKYCSFSALIQKDHSIYLADTVMYEGICDNYGNYLPNSDSTFVISKVGLIDKNGFIKLNKENRQATKNSP